MNRRRVLRLGAIGVAALAGLGPLVGQRLRSRRADKDLAEACRAALVASFPSKVTDDPAAAAFMDAYLPHARRYPARFSPANTPIHFLTSTNVIVHLETGEPLSFDMIFDPLESPCSNHLGAFYAPVGEHRV